jgi:hypothetical protein
MSLHDYGEKDVFGQSAWHSGLSNIKVLWKGRKYGIAISYRSWRYGELMIFSRRGGWTDSIKPTMWLFDRWYFNKDPSLPKHVSDKAEYFYKVKRLLCSKKK